MLLRRATLCVLLLTLTACSSALRWQPDYHTVRAGETLYSIAVRYDIDHRQLASWNRLGSGNYIRQGQKLRLTPPPAGSNANSSRPPAPPPPTYAAPRWYWPTSGKVAAGFGGSAETASGIRIAGSAGQPVVAVAAGEVVYAGNGLPSYGNLLIVEHNETWLSAYGFNSRLRVKEGDKVKAQQRIADMGQTPAGDVRLHFEIRRNGKPVDPLRYLPKR